MQHLMFSIIFVAFTFVNCNKNISWTPEKPVLSTSDKHLIEQGLYFSEDTLRAGTSCDCESTSKDEYCKIFCIASRYIPIIHSLSRYEALRLILIELSGLAGCIDEPYAAFHPDSFIGTGILLYFFNSEEDDQIIRDHFSKDSNLSAMFFSPTTRIGAYAWIYNRPDPHKWALVLDSLNENSEKWIETLHKYCKRYLPKNKCKYDYLQNPFKNALKSIKFTEDSLHKANSMKSLETEMKCTEKYKMKSRIQDYDNIALTQIGLEYPKKWSKKADDCYCDSIPSYTECRLFCTALNSVAKILANSRIETLNSVLSDLSIFANDTNEAEFNRRHATGAGILLYYFNTVEEDEKIRECFSKDTNLMKLFFAPDQRIIGFGWFFNRPDRKKWCNLISASNYYNPFIDSLFKMHVRYDSIRYCVPLKILEHEIRQNELNGKKRVLN